MSATNVVKKSFALRLGQAIGSGVGRVLRSERTLWAGMVGKGLPSALVAPVKWLVRSAVAAGLVAVAAAWALCVLAVVAMFMIVVGLLSRASSQEFTSISSSTGYAVEDEVKDSSGWMSGPQGYGFYDSNGFKH